MKAKYLSIFLAIFVYSATAFGQQEVFKILASKGTNKVVSGGADQKVLIGKKLFAADKIVIGENSYLGLAHSSGKTIELKKAGTYEVSKLSSEVASQNAGVAKKYVDFVAGEMASGDEDMAKNRHKYMAVTGSVEREITELSAISSICPQKVFCLADPILLKWRPATKASTYVITITNMSDEPVFTAETNENFVLIDLAKINLKDLPSKTVLWKVGVKGLPDTESVPKAISYVDQNPSISKVDILEKEAADMRNELKEETALNKFVLASYYQEKGLILEAVANYEAAIKLEPEVEDYKAAYGQFLTEAGLIEKEGEK
jgi:hypothetical protein